MSEYYYRKKRGEGLTEQKCLKCGQSFMPTRDNQKYCSSECRHKIINYAECVICGKSFQTSKHYKKFCSEACKKQREKDLEAWSLKPIKGQCEWCKIEFTKQYFASKYCSHECKKKAYKRKDQIYKQRKKKRLSKDKEQQKLVDFENFEFEGSDGGEVALAKTP